MIQSPWSDLLSRCRGVINFVDVVTGVMELIILLLLSACSCVVLWLLLIRCVPLLPYIVNLLYLISCLFLFVYWFLLDCVCDRTLVVVSYATLLFDHLLC